MNTLSLSESNPSSGNGIRASDAGDWVTTVV
jgi:hypothetical protein